MMIRVGLVLKRKRREHGFSLVELLVSMAVASILIAALMQSLVSASDSWTRQSKHFSSQREGRTALRILADDLASLTSIPAGGPLSEDPSGVASAPFRFLVQSPSDGISSTRMAFLRTAKRMTTGRDAGRGDVRLVLYGVVLTDDGGASGLDPDAKSQKLVRRELSAEETFRRLEAHRLKGQPVVFETDWVSLEVMQESGIEVATHSVLAHDVIQFDLKALESLVETTPRTGPWPQELAPKWVDATLRVTNRSTGRWLRSLMDWRGQGERAEQLTNGTPEIYHDDPEVRTFTMRLRLPSVSW
jgi:prepilin-type N-terminal cleavage/methylation domain-containing protein